MSTGIAAGPYILLSVDIVDHTHDRSVLLQAVQILSFGDFHRPDSIIVQDFVAGGDRDIAAASTCPFSSGGWAFLPKMLSMEEVAQ